MRTLVLKKRYSWAAAFLGLYILCFSNVDASLLELNSSARPQGLGGAFTALADDVTAMFYNPSGLTEISSNEVSASYSGLYIGLLDESRLFEGTVLGAHSFRNFGTIGIGWQTTGLSQLYQENRFMIAYGIMFPESLATSLNMGFISRLAIGVTVNVLNIQIGTNSYTEVNSTIEDFSETNVSLSVGVKYPILEGLHIGVAIRDILEPDISLTSSAQNQVPSTLVMGVAYRWKKMETLTTVMDISLRRSELMLRLGAEKWFLGKQFAVRSGLMWGQDEAIKDLLSFSAGLGYELKFNQYSTVLDYAAIFPLQGGISETAGSHRFTLSFKW